MKVSRSVYRFGWARAAVKSWDAWRLSGALSWSLCSLYWFPSSGVSQLFCKLPRLGAAEAASYEGLVTECEVRDTLKQVGINKSPGLDGLPYEVYLRLPHMFLPILTDVLNHWFAQEAIPGSITKGVIPLLKKGGMHVWEGLDDYNLDQSKAFDRVDHQFLASVLETAGFKSEFCRLISMMYHNSQAMVKVNGPARYPFCWPSYSKCFRVRRWYHRLCVLPSGHRGYEKDGCWVRTNSRSQGQFWQKRRFVAQCLDG